MGRDEDKSLRRRWAELRFAIVGPLLAAPPGPGGLGEAIREQANKLWVHPKSGAWVKFGFSTIERWYYGARNAADPLAALTRRTRDDAGLDRVMSAALLRALEKQYRAHQRWSYQLHADNLVALTKSEPVRYGPAPSYSTVRRRMLRNGWLKQRGRRARTKGQQRAAERLDSREVRSYETEHVHALWHWDFHVGSLRVVDAAGQWHTPVAFATLDDYSRWCSHMQWYLVESAETLCHGLRQAFLKRGLPRSGMSDNGGAMRAGETVAGLERLGILWQPTLPYSPYQNAKQEVFWASVEGRLLAMLEGVEGLTLSFLNRATQAWADQEYNRAHHDEIGCSPLERLLAGPEVSRPAPDHAALRLAFSVRERRTQRKSDGTVSIEGTRFELPSRLRTLSRVWVRFQSWDLTTAWVVDEHDNVLARIRPQDKVKNASGQRRLLEPVGDAIEPSSGSDAEAGELPPLMLQLLAEYAATGLPPAYLPLEERALETAPSDQEQPSHLDGHVDGPEISHV